MPIGAAVAGQIVSHGQLGGTEKLALVMLALATVAVMFDGVNISPVAAGTMLYVPTLTPVKL